LIHDQQVEAALESLNSTADQLGEAWGRVCAQEHLIKQYRARAFIAASGPVAQRDAIARLDKHVLQAQKDYAEAQAEYRTLLAQREHQKLTIEVWRTQSASNRAQML
jgi:hypothetical protein